MNSTITTKVVYGFEYNNLIYNDECSIVCKSFVTNNPIYCSIIIDSTYIDEILSIIYFVSHDDDSAFCKNKIMQMAKKRGCVPKWQIVLYDDENQMMFDNIEYERTLGDVV